MSEPKLVAVVGETAAGKSSVAMDIARRFNGEIINADSWQIYRGMDIGTAKPAQHDRREIPHHLIDIVDPDDDFNAALYKRMALESIDTINANHKLPILTGGTGLYVDSVLFDYSFAPQSDPDTRSYLNSLGRDELLELIDQRGLDLTGIDTRNKRRLVRLIEAEGRRPTSKDLRHNTLVVGVGVRTRAQLRQNIENRVEQMFRRGLKHEVRELAEKYGWEIEAMKGIGYKEFRPFFEGQQSLSETKRRIIKSTLELAKRQRTWFKRNRHIQWVYETGEALRLVDKFQDRV